jgi:hypothetical protein
MRLSEENIRRLNRLVWRDRARRWLPGLAAFVVLVAVLTLFFVQQRSRMDQTVEVQRREGQVTGVKRNAPGASIVRVHLDDGRDIEAFSALRVVPHAGSHVHLTEARHASGRSTYDVTGMSD